MHSPQDVFGRPWREKVQLLFTDAPKPIPKDHRKFLVAELKKEIKTIKLKLRFEKFHRNVDRMKEIEGYMPRLEGELNELAAALKTVKKG